MKKEQLVKEIGKSFLIPLGILQGFCFLFIFSSPFIWLWYNWTAAWKIGLSGLFGVIIVGIIYNFIYKQVEKIVDEKINQSK